MGIGKRNRETIVYLCLWIIVFTLYLVDEFKNRADMNLPIADVALFIRMAAILGPFIVLFLINNYLLIPRFLLTNKIRKYIVSVFIILTSLMLFKVTFSDDIKGHKPPIEMKANYRKDGNFDHPGPKRGPRPRKPPRPFSALPFIFDLTYGLLIIGGNVAIALVFQRYDDRLEKEKLMKTNVENQLIYLKAQINPHFYMNMLNNIHGMMEINIEKAQSMVVDMSRLMRYMLYESSKPLIFLEKEISFLINYIELMRLRFDKEKVRLTYDFPEEKYMNGIKVPPLLFLAFIENAFKHGVSYQQESFISVSIEITSSRIKFRCFNTMGPTTRHEKTGVGLNNIRQRIELLYGNSTKLHIEEKTNTYTVTLSIPYDEN